jgi:hypothetical protein
MVRIKVKFAFGDSPQTGIIMLVSRVPCVGEGIAIEGIVYEVKAVLHYPDAKTHVASISVVPL